MPQSQDLLAQRFPQFPHPYAMHLASLLCNFFTSGLASPHLIEEISSGDIGKLWSRLWEAMLYRHLLACGFTPHAAPGDEGPDFSIEYQKRTIWIEAVVPSPVGISPCYLEPPKKGIIEFRRVPYEERLLRWTSVLRDKRAKLELYKTRGIIKDDDCTVIAVNSARLQDWAPHDLGNSRLPFAVEAVFPIGPLAYPITASGQPDGNPENVPRYMIRKTTGICVPTDNFLNQCYANVSAILGCYQRPKSDEDLSLTLVHNPLATICLPEHIFKVQREYSASQKGDHYVLRQL